MEHCGGKKKPEWMESPWYYLVEKWHLHMLAGVQQVKEGKQGHELPERRGKKTPDEYAWAKAEG